MTDSFNPPELPEEFAASLQQDPQTGQWLFALSGPSGKQTVETTKSFVIETLLSILKNKLPDPAMSIKFIGYMASKHLGSMLLGIFVSKLFDSARDKTLNTIVNVHMRNALGELQFALNEPTSDGKRYHRMQADNHVGSAYQAVAIKLAALQSRWITVSGQISRHLAQAAYLALLKAFLSYEAGLEATRSWAEIAWTHYEAYDTLEAAPLRHSIAYMHHALEELQNGTSWTVIHPIYDHPEGGKLRTRRKTAIHDIEQELASAEEKVIQFDHDLQYFYEICQALTRQPA